MLRELDGAGQLLLFGTSKMANKEDAMDEPSSREVNIFDSVQLGGASRGFIETAQVEIGFVMLNLGFLANTAPGFFANVFIETMEVKSTIKVLLTFPLDIISSGVDLTT